MFNLSFDGDARMKLVASDLGRYEREDWVDNVTIAPAERYVVDVRFPDNGRRDARQSRARHRPHHGAVLRGETRAGCRARRRGVRRRRITAPRSTRFGANAAVTAEIDPYRKHFARPVDHELAITLQPGDLPFPMRPLLSLESVYRNPVEWSGTMPEMDWIVTGKNVRWVLRDTADQRARTWTSTGAFASVTWSSSGWSTTAASLHAMHHPIHIHGQRFLVLSVNGVPNENLVWKDTVLAADGLCRRRCCLEVTNPGKWMLHCHIAEHIETGMRMVFRGDAIGPSVFAGARCGMRARRNPGTEFNMTRTLVLVMLLSVGLAAQSMTSLSNDVRQYVTVPETSVALTQRARRRRHGRRRRARVRRSCLENGKITSVSPAAGAKVPGGRAHDRSDGPHGDSRHSSACTTTRSTRRADAACSSSSRRRACIWVPASRRSGRPAARRRITRST